MSIAPLPVRTRLYHGENLDSYVGATPPGTSACRRMSTVLCASVGSSVPSIGATLIV